MKKLHLLKTVFLLCALVVGSMNGWATDVTYTISSKNTLSTTGTAPAGSSATMAETYSTSKQMTSGNSQTLTLKGYNGNNITKIVLSMRSNQSGGAGKLSYSTDGGSNYTYIIGTSDSGVSFNQAAWNGAWSTSYTNVTKDNLSIACSSSDVVVKIEATANSLYCESYTITYEASSSSLIDSNLALTGAPVALNFDLYNSSDAQEVSYTTSSTGAVTVSGGTGYVTTSVNTGTKKITVTPTGQTPDANEGYVTITVNQAADNTYKAGSKTFTVKVANSDPDKAGTENTPYTVSQARSAIDNGVGLTGYATGTVSEIVTVYSTQYSNISFNISVDGETSSAQLQAFRCGGTNAANVHIGDEVVVSGTLEKNSSTYRFASGCQLVSINHSAVPVINTNNVSTKTLEYNTTSGEIAYEINHPTEAALNAVITDGDWISNLAVGADKVTFTASANTANERTATITLSYTGAANKVITIKQKKYNIATIPFAFDGGRDELGTTVGFTQDGLGTDYGSSPKLKFDTTGDYVILRINEGGTLSFDIKGNDYSKGSTSTFKVQTSEDGSAYTDLATYTELGTTSTKTFVLDDAVRYIKWIYTEKGATNGGNVSLGNIVITKVAEPEKPTTSGTTVTLTTTANMDGWRTFYPSKANQAYTTDADVYYASATGGSTVTLTKIDDGVPANTPVILHKDGATTIELTETGTDITAPGASNLLKVSTAGQNLGKVYRLGYKTSDGVGFYTYTTTSAPAGIIYVNSIPGATARDFLGFDFGDETTGVNEVKAQKVDGQYFNLAGQRVAQPTKGLYIVNGKKVIVK